MLPLRFRLFPTRANCFSLPPRRPLFFTPHNRFPRNLPLNVPDKSLPELPSFRDQISRASASKSFTDTLTRPSVLRQVLFTVFGSFALFSVAAIQTNDDTEWWTKKMVTDNGFFQLRPPTSDEITRAKYIELAEKLRSQLRDLSESLSGFPTHVQGTIVWAAARVAQAYYDARETRRLCWMLIGINGAVFLAWQIPNLRRAMARRFLHHPLSGLSYTLLTSTFSHKAFFHFLFNSLALSSFGAAAGHYLAIEQRNGGSGLQESTPIWHFLAFYISAGLFSGLTSHVIAARIRYPRFLSQLTAVKSNPTQPLSISAPVATKIGSAADDIIRPSLGASGAIYSCATLVALGYPDSEISLFIPSSFSVPIQWGMGGLVLMDVVGVLRGWRMFDHWAHLGGAAFGALYFVYGPRFWDSMRATTKHAEHAIVG
ncbi:hypothetical protein JAAARDRAFT_185971 [Jaapia argillacea MUCL 33604]|uniref:Peptidase S54 rhomboid domain-containing protein n=1 Tax=Jaapia argillacea MUCL 33604 TaxID=933084 RepID=A0A067PJX9_9AGAM|nr:hypothetical protein JAAARDRAFT_185971 [Jaapia argillacea MUCL 33604]